MTSRFSRTKNYSLRIQNAFIFLQNTYGDIKPEWFNDIDLSVVKSIEDVYVITLCKVVNVISRRGLYREYLRIEDDELISPKGRIDISKSVTRQTRLRGKLVCSYDELSDNVIHNQIIKTVLVHMIYNKNITREFIYLIQKTLNELNGIDTLELKDINWKRIRFNNSNLRYKTALDICKSLIGVEEIHRLVDYTFEDKLYIMFTKHLYHHYSKAYSNKFEVSKVTSDKWTSENKFEKLVSKSRTYVTIKKDKDVLIVGFELYSPWLGTSEEDAQLKQLKQVCEYYESFIGNIKTKMALIYINPGDGYTDKEEQIVNVDGKIAGVTTVDCNIGYQYIKYKLNQLVHILLK